MERLITILLSVMPLIAWCDNISFADANVKAICVANWDTSGDSELSYAEAEAVKNLGTIFKYNTDITSFDELQLLVTVRSLAVQV